jgi:hypothetical protein
MKIIFFYHFSVKQKLVLGFPLYLPMFQGNLLLPSSRYLPRNSPSSEKTVILMFMTVRNLISFCDTDCTGVMDSFKSQTCMCHQLVIPQERLRLNWRRLQYVAYETR